ncbi:MAG: TonB family protein [Acidobacteria bacterium]|nr:TonB family protein [Acidobacteriota bacterium]
MKETVGDTWKRLEIWLGLRPAPADRAGYVYDPYNIFEDPLADRRPLRTAILLALLFHIFMFLIVFPTGTGQILFPSPELIQLKNLAAPPAGGGGGSQVKASPPEKVISAPKPAPTFVPIPDPTPDAPEPIRPRKIEATVVVEQISDDINIGDITAPPGLAALGGSGGGTGSGRGPGGGSGSGGGSGAGSGGGTGDGVYAVGGGITEPVLLVETRPSYTDEAIKAKVQGVVLLQGVVRKNGRVDSLKIARALGYGLDERAIQEISTNWRFKPGTMNGRPVDVYATIEVTFSLR